MANNCSKLVTAMQLGDDNLEYADTFDGGASNPDINGGADLFRRILAERQGWQVGRSSARRD